MVEIDDNSMYTRPEGIVAKCVVSMRNTLTNTYIITALANTVETD